MDEKPGPRKREILERLGRREKSKITPKPERKQQMLERLGLTGEMRANAENSKELIARAAEIMRKRDNFLRDQKAIRDSNYPGYNFLQLEIIKLGEQLQLIFAELSLLGVDRGEALQAIKMISDENAAREREGRPPRGSRK